MFTKVKRGFTNFQAIQNSKHVFQMFSSHMLRRAPENPQPTHFAQLSVVASSGHSPYPNRASEGEGLEMHVGSLFV